MRFFIKVVSNDIVSFEDCTIKEVVIFFSRNNLSLLIKEDFISLTNIIGIGLSVVDHVPLNH